MTREKSGALPRVLRNFFTLLGGRAVGGVLALAATLLSARALGPSGFGMVAVIHAYTQTIRGLVNLKPFEAIVRYGVPHIERGELGSLGALLRVCAVIDAAAATLGTLAAIGLAELAANFGLWSADTAALAKLYACVLLFSGYATASGCLRVFDRFDAISKALVLSNAARLVGIVWVTQSGQATVEVVAMIWAMSQVVQYAGILWYGWHTAFLRLGRAQLLGRIDFVAVSTTHAGLWRFLSVVYWQSTLDLVPKSGATLLAGGLLGNEGAGLYRIAREFANFVSKPALLARQAIYPDLARLRHRQDTDFRRVIIAVTLLLALPALLATGLIAFFGASLLALAVGAGYTAAAALLTWLVAAATIELAGAPLRPAAYTLGRAGVQLRVQIAASLVFVLVFTVATQATGLIGPGIAASVFYALMLAGNGLVVWQAMRRDA